MLSRVGSYDVLGQVAETPAGGLWQGRDPGLDRLVALKRVADPTSSAAQQLRDEARLLAGISHPHIVTVYDLIENTDGVWLAEEWVNGHTLRIVAAQAGKLTPAQAVGTVRDALQGLAHTHALGIVHGDITPANILIDEAGTSKLIDFGLARPLGESAGSGTGTPGYISPQLAQGHPADPTDDVYAAGAVLASLLTGRALFPGASPAAVLAAQLGSAPDLTGVAHNTKAVLSTALQNGTDDRYADAAAFLRALEEAARRDLGPEWLAEAGVAALVTAIGAGTATTVIDSEESPATQQVASGKTARRGLRNGRRSGKLLARSSIKGMVAAASAGAVAVTAAAVVLTSHHHTTLTAASTTSALIAPAIASRSPRAAAASTSASTSTSSPAKPGTGSTSRPASGRTTAVASPTAANTAAMSAHVTAAVTTSLCSISGLSATLGPRKHLQYEQDEVTIVLTNTGHQPCVIDSTEDSTKWLQVSLHGPSDPNGTTWQLQGPLQPAPVVVPAGGHAHIELTYLPYSPGSLGSLGSTVWVPTDVQIGAQSMLGHLTIPWSIGSTVLRQDEATHQGTFVGPPLPGAS